VQNAGKLLEMIKADTSSVRSEQKYGPKSLERQTCLSIFEQGLEKRIYLRNIVIQRLPSSF